MESLNQLLEACSLPEKTRLVEFAKIKNPPCSKKLMLMKLFVNQPGLSDSEYSHKIYGRPESAAYFQLKKRVKDEFEELLILLKPTCAKKETQLHIGCSELLLQSQLILARGIRIEGAKLLERGLKMAIKNAFYDLILPFYSTAARFGLCEVLNTSDLPELEIAIKSHLQLLIKKNYHGPEEHTQTKNRHLKTMIRQLNSSRNSWFILDDIRRSIEDKKYQNAMSQVNEAESEWNYATESKTKDELLIAKMSILLAQREFDKLLNVCTGCADTSDFSQENVLRHSMNHWYALFHLDKNEDAQQFFCKNLMNKDSNQNPTLAYLEAYLYYKLRNLKSALKQIHFCQKILKSIPDYYLGSKMLELMILFDQNDQDWLEYKIENLRKLIARKKGRINKRIEQGFILFSKLQKSLNKPGIVDITNDINLVNLQLETDGMEWNPSAFELIRYDSWIIATLQGQRS